MAAKRRPDERIYYFYYWPTIQGRGEFVRLALEDAGARYVDVARKSGARSLDRVLNAAKFPAFAPPAVSAGDLVVFQTANILQWIAPQIGLAPRSDASRVRAHQLQLTIADLVAETHDTHHPVSVSLYYEDQRVEAKKRAASFVRDRIPKFLKYFERGIDARGYAIDERHTYVDLSLFQVVAGLTYAFPNRMKGLARTIPKLRTLSKRVAGRPRMAAYLASKRRIPFNEEGVFRHYQELDRPPPLSRST